LTAFADVGLVLQQSSDSGVGVRRTGRQADDRQPRPGDVVLPELAHVGAERDRLAGLHRRRVSDDGDGLGLVRLVAVREGVVAV
jgi:hypothetical protein